VATQYGSGASFQAQCPAFPPAPNGYVAWDTNVNGPIPSDVQAHAKTLANDMSKPLGYSDTIYSSGVPIVVRVDAHTWTTDASGNVVEGCFHGADVFVPVPGSSPATPASSSSPSASLFSLALVLGAIASSLAIVDHVRR